MKLLVCNYYFVNFGHMWLIGLEKSWTNLTSHLECSEIIFMHILSIFKIELDFFKKRIRKYQEKKLDEITSKIQFHQYTKNQLEEKIDEMINDEKTVIIKEISYHSKMINIWKNNEEKLKKQMSEMEDS